MKKFWQLLNDELLRARLFYLLLVGFVFVGEGSITVVYLWRYFKNDGILYNPNMMNSLTYRFLIIVGMAAMALFVYSIIQWVREWQSRDHFIYRLMLLPGNRFSIGLSKLVSVLIMTIGLIGWQVLLYCGLYHLFREVLFPGVYPNVSGIESLLSSNVADTLSGVIIPVTFTAFLFFYGIGLAFLLIIYNMIVLYYSYRNFGFWRVVMVESILIALSFIYTLATMWGYNWVTVTFLSSVRCGYIFSTIGLMIVGQLALHYYLLNHKLSV